MQKEYFDMMKSLAPDLVQEIEMRALVLERIHALAPVGRRQLAQLLRLPEREVRAVASLLRANGLVRMEASGMYTTEQALSVLPAARMISRDLRGLAELEERLTGCLNVDRVRIIRGDADQDEIVLREVGKEAAVQLQGFLHDGTLLAVTGGQTIREAADGLVSSSPVNVTVVPARGGIGDSLETQSNTVAEEMAKRLGGHYRAMYLPDRMDEQALVEMRKLPEVDQILELLERADVVLHGIARADVMMKRRRLPDELCRRLEQSGAAAEAYSCYFNMAGEKIYSASTVANDLGILKPDCSLIAVAAGASKAMAILAVMRNRRHNLLVTDEGAARALLSLVQADQ